MLDTGISLVQLMSVGTAALLNGRKIHLYNPPKMDGGSDLTACCKLHIFIVTVFDISTCNKYSIYSNSCMCATTARAPETASPAGSVIVWILWVFLCVCVLNENC